MALSELTHLWVEAPLLSNALEKLPPHVTVLWGTDSPEDPTANAGPAQAILAASGVQYDAPLLARLPNLRILVRVGIGVDNVDIPAATARGVLVCNTPDGPTESTAEHTVAMLLALAKRLKQGDAVMAAGEFAPRPELIGNEVQGKVLGLVGLGRIGRRVATICRLGLGMDVLAFDPYLSPEQAAELGVTLVDLPQLLAQADFLSLHAPATPETHKLMDREHIGQMKPGAYLLNLARGPLVDEAALLEAVESGRLAGAALDVFDPEPPEPDAPIRRHPNILVTPHTASLTWEGRGRMEEMALARVLAFFRGERPADALNPEVLG